MAKEEKVDSDPKKREERKKKRKKHTPNLLMYEVVCFRLFVSIVCLFSVFFLFLSFLKQGLSKPELMMEKAAVADVAFPS